MGSRRPRLLSSWTPQVSGPPRALSHGAALSACTLEGAHSCSRLLSPVSPFRRTFDQLPQGEACQRGRREKTPKLSPGVEEPWVGLCLRAGAGVSAQCLSFGSIFPLSKCHCFVAVKVFALVTICLSFVICAY